MLAMKGGQISKSASQTLNRTGTGVHRAASAPIPVPPRKPSTFESSRGRTRGKTTQRSTPSASPSPRQTDPSRVSSIYSMDDWESRRRERDAKVRARSAKARAERDLHFEGTFFTSIRSPRRNDFTIHPEWLSERKSYKAEAPLMTSSVLRAAPPCAQLSSARRSRSAPAPRTRNPITWEGW